MDNKNNNIELELHKILADNYDYGKLGYKIYKSYKALNLPEDLIDMLMKKYYSEAFGIIYDE